MARTRVSTTVDGELLARARGLRAGAGDVVTRLGRVSDIRMSEVCTALNIAVSCGL